MRVGALEYAMAWRDPHANRQFLEKNLQRSAPAHDLIVLPEMWSTGFTMDPTDVAETMSGPTVDAMIQWAQSYDCNLVGSLIILDEGRYYNRLISALPDGTLHHYDKQKLFSYAGEDKSYTAGQETLIYEYQGWRICPLICYDLRFPALADRADYDLLVYTASWPSTRAAHWNALLQARAIENQSYVLGCNRVGTDRNDLSYQGDSQVLDYQGLRIDRGESMTETDAARLCSAVLDHDSLMTYREKLPFLQDK